MKGCLMQLHGIRFALLFFSLMSPLLLHAESKDILFIRHGQSSHNLMMAKKRKLQKLKSVIFSRKKIKDANLTQNGILEALRLRSYLSESLSSEDPKLKFVAETMLDPRDDVLVLSSNLRRAVNTGLLVLYGDDRDKDLSLKSQQPIYPIYVSSLLQEWGVPKAIPDVKPYSKSFFQKGQLINESLQSSLGSFAGQLQNFLKIFPNDRDISPEGHLRRGEGNTKPLKEKYVDFLDNIVFGTQSNEALQLTKKQTFIVFGHGRWLKGFVNFIKTEYQPKLGIVPNGSLTHLRVKKQGDGSYRLVSQEFYQALN